MPPTSQSSIHSEGTITAIEKGDDGRFKVSYQAEDGGEGFFKLDNTAVLQTDFTTAAIGKEVEIEMRMGAKLTKVTIAGEQVSPPQNTPA